RYGHGTPDDWMERNLYTRCSVFGVFLMLATDLLLFGVVPGVLIWLAQIAWIPFWAAGVINGVGHFFGYRSYDVADASTNIVPWGFLIGGEELHNNHHTFASSAKFSSKWWELDIGWFYIRAMETVGLAKVKKIPPELTCDSAKQHIDIETVKAVINGRFVVLSHFLREVVLRVHREELKKAKPANREFWALLKSARGLLVREAALLDEAKRKWLH